MGNSNIIMIVLVLGIGYYLYSTGKLQEIFGELGNIGGGGGSGIDANVSGGDQEIAQAGGNGDIDIDVEGENAGACANGRCKGDPRAISRAQELLDDIRNR